MSTKALKRGAPSSTKRRAKKLNPSVNRLGSNELNDKTVLKVFKGVTNFYGNNTVYITDGNRVQKLEDYNYQIEAVQDTGDDIWITSGVIVALGACCELPDAVRQLEIVLGRLKADAWSAEVTEQSPKPEKFGVRNMRTLCRGDISVNVPLLAISCAQVDQRGCPSSTEGTAQNASRNLVK